MAAKYVYRTIDVQSNQVLEDIDLQAVQFKIKLSGVGDLSGDLPVPESKRGLLLDSATYPGRTGIYVLRNGIPVWGGIIWKRDWDEKESKFRLSCGSWESYAYHILQLKTLSYTNTDQYEIARDILGQNGIQIESGITWPAIGITGMKRQRNMFSYDYKTVGLELEQLAGLENGFDYTIQNYIKEDGSFGRRYVFGYPRLGRSASLDPAANSLTFDYPGNLAPFGLQEDAENGATSLFAIGAGEGTTMLTAHAGDGTLGIGSVPLQTQAASAILSRLAASQSISSTNWTWSGAPSYVASYGAYLKDLATQDSVEANPITDSDVGQVPGPTQSAQAILAQLNTNQASVFEDWTWQGAPAIVGQYNDMLTMLFYKAYPGTTFPANIPQAKTWLTSYISAHPAPTSASSTIDWTAVQEWLTKYIQSNPAPYVFDPTPDTEYGPWPRLDMVASYKDVKLLPTLQSHANEDLNKVTPPIFAWTLELAADSDLSISDINIGDSAVFRLWSRRWKDPIEMIRRITEITVSPGDHGELESVKLGLADERT